nr:hypothetical protein CFP56_33677 [Quercus suber]POE56711.1 hypothetical protein CFP56_33683 [Quercus suber]
MAMGANWRQRLWLVVSAAPDPPPTRSLELARFAASPPHHLPARPASSQARGAVIGGGQEKQRLELAENSFADVASLRADDMPRRRRPSARLSAPRR